MTFVSHITKARVQARIIYIQALARPKLPKGNVTIELGAGSALAGEIKPWDGKLSVVVACPDLYAANASCPQLPLRLNDYVDYTIQNGRILISQIRRGSVGGNTAPPPQGRPAKLNLTGAPPATRVKRQSKSKADLFRDLLALKALPQLPTYLKKHKKAIEGLKPQDLPPWQNRYDSLDGKVMEQLKALFPNKTISRPELVALYSQWKDPRLCLIATMVWGNIDANRKGRLAGLLKVGSEKVVEVMNSIRCLLRSQELADAFARCAQNGELKLPGVGVSFFTKLFFFIGQVKPALRPAPLIFDKWTMNAFYALAKQSRPSVDWNQYFTPLKNPRNDEVTMWAIECHQPLLYPLYVSWMNHWANELGVPASTLEQFIFGFSRITNAGKSPNNPRNELLKLANPASP